jgi:sulfide:quinone oxidoreductase
VKRVVILGGGSGGAVAAKRLARWSRDGEFEVVLIDRSPWHEYRPSYLWVMTGRREPDQVRRPLSVLGDRYGTKVVNAEVISIQPDGHRVETDSGGFDYDYLIVALGAELQRSEATSGLEAPWELDDALAARGRLADFDGGRIVVGVESWPYRCPPAPFEAAMMMRYLAEQRGVSEKTDISVFHTWQKPMETFGPLMVDGFSRFLDQRQVRFEGGFELDGHDRSDRTLRSKDGRDLSYDLALVVPAHRAPAVIANAGLVADGGYMDVRLPSMASPAHEDVWGIGDAVAPTIGLGMAGVFAHFQAEHVVTQIIDRTRGTYVGELYNMVGICVMDTGYEGAAVWCDFTDKLRGHSDTPDCRMLGGMRAFRAVKSGFEAYWFANLFGG